MKYRREIDGLRALAVIPVIFFHAGFSVFSGGFVGVDVFFVISGYLITTIIISELEKGTFSIINFYERRARRILPALFFVLLITGIFAILFLDSSTAENFFESLATVSIFSSNIFFWQETGYFDTSSELKPLLHTWSLAVEEQFYVLFPIILMICWKFGIYKILSFLLVIFIASLSLAQWSTYNTPDAAFFLLHNRAWELLIGSFIAFYFFSSNYYKPGKTLKEFASLAGIVALLSSIFIFDSKTPFPSVYALIPTIGTALIILFSDSGTIVGRLLSHRWAVYIGLISYSAYLWHQPIFSIYRYITFEQSKAIYSVLTLLTLVIAFLSWKYVETPFRDKNHVLRKNIFSYSLIGSIIFFCVGIYGSSELITKTGLFNPTRITIPSYIENNNILKKQSWELLRSIANDDSYNISNNPFDNQLWFSRKIQKYRILLVGNSHSKDIYNVLYHSNSTRENFEIARFGTQIKDLKPNHRLFHSPNYKAADVIMLVSRYKNEDISNMEWTIQKMQADGKFIVIVKNVFEYPEYQHGRLSEIDREVFKWNMKFNNLRKIAEKVNYKYYKLYTDQETRAVNRSTYINKNIEEIFSNYDDLIILDRMDYICNSADKMCYAVSGNLNKYFYDYGHHTSQGGQFFGKRVDSSRWMEPIKNILSNKKKHLLLGSTPSL